MNAELGQSIQIIFEDTCDVIATRFQVYQRMSRSRLATCQRSDWRLVLLTLWNPGKDFRRTKE